MKILIINSSITQGADLVNLHNALQTEKHSYTQISSLQEDYGLIDDYNLAIYCSDSTVSMNAEYLKNIKMLSSQLPVIAATDSDNEEHVLTALKHGATEIISTKDNTNTIILAIKKAIARTESTIEQIQRGNDIDSHDVEDLAAQKSTNKSQKDELKTIEAHLYKIEKKYKLLFEDTPIGIFKSDLNGTIKDANSELAKLLGYESKTDLIESKVNLQQNVCISPEYFDSILMRLSEAKGKIVHQDLMRRKDGSTFFANISCKIIRNSEGAAKSIIGFIDDITEYKHALDKINENNFLMNAILSNIPFDFWARRKDLSIIFQSDISKQTWGELFIPSDEDNTIDPLTAEIWKDNNKRALSGETVSEEVKLTDKNGKTYDIHNIIAPIYIGNEIMGILGFNIDISARKQAEQILHDNEDKFRSIIEQSIDGIALMNEAGVIQVWNKAIETITGIARDYAVNKNIFEIVSELVVHKIDIWKHEPLKHNLMGYFKPWQTNEDRTHEIEILAKSGEKKTLLLTNFQIKTRKETLVASILKDITIQKNAENELKNLIIALKVSNNIAETKTREVERLNEQLLISEKQLKATNESKDKFFSIIAHDLKGPLGSFKNVTEILSEGYKTLNEIEIKEFISNMNISAKHLYDLLENLLTWARSQTGRIDFNPDNYDLTHIINNCIHLLKTSITNKEIKIINNVEGEIHAYVDANMISSIIRNLLTNAIKFSFKGSKITISVADEGNYYRLSVCDNGIGMTDEVIEKLFRIDLVHSTTGTANETGSGLGLILCKEFILKHNGRIWVESKPGKGSRFYLTLPKTKAALEGIE
jgi:PAS domain S-box-containing protein